MTTWIEQRVAALEQRAAELAKQVRGLTSTELVLSGAGDPNGIVSAVQGTHYWDITNQNEYVNTSIVGTPPEGTVWTLLGGVLPPPALPHNILSVTHPNTVPAAIADGDVLVGNVTALLERLPITVPPANVRNALAVDNGELRPTWKATLDAVAPTTVAAGAIAAAGTSLIYSHRDHTHGAPATYPATAHNVLDATYHGDVLTGAVARGDLLYGNSTPKIARLALGGITGSVVTRDATDVLWSTGALSFAGAFTLTVPATGTAVLGGGSGASPRVAYWSDANTLTSDAGLTVDAANDMFIVANAGGIGNAVGTARLMLDSSGATDYASFMGCAVGIATATPQTTNGGLDIASGGIALILGADSGASTRTDATQKVGKFGCAHYTNAQPPFATIWGTSLLNNNILYIGGGTATFNAATLIRFYTAANYTTLTGTERMSILSNGYVGINKAAPTAQLHIDQSSATGAIPVLTLDQADDSEEFINFISTVGAGAPIDTAALGAYYGKARVQVDGVGYKYIALYN